MLAERAGMSDDPLMFAINLTHEGNKRMSTYINKLTEDGDIIGDDARRRLGTICADRESTRAVTYLDMNPGLSSHSVYSPDSVLEDDLRIPFTRLRVSSHRLRIETGRWARPAIDRERRLCTCGAVQTEEHVVVECPLVQHLREKYSLGAINFHEFVTAPKSVNELRYLRDVFDHFAE